MTDIRWFAPNHYTTLVVPELRRRGLSVDLEGSNAARLTGGFRSHRRYYSRLRYIAAHAAELWVPSESSLGGVRDQFGLPSRKVPYWYDSDRFRPAARGRGAPPTLLTVSRLEPHKNQAATLRAAARLGREVQVRLIGQDTESSRLEQLAREAYHRACVAVCPSWFEGFGLTPVEAIASATPVVASGIPPHREFAGNSATFFPLDDDDALTAAIERALEGPDPHAAAVEELTIPAAAERFRHFLEPLLS